MNRNDDSKVERKDEQKKKPSSNTIFPLISSVRLDSALRLSPGIRRIPVLKSGTNQHLLLFGQKTNYESLILLGKLNESTTGDSLLNANIWLDVSRPKVILVFGRRGTGKSYDLGVLIEGLMSPPSQFRLGSYKPAIVVFDPKNELWTLSFEPDPQDTQEKLQLQLLNEWGLDPQTIEKVIPLVPAGSEIKLPGSLEFGINVSDMDENDWCAFFGFNKYNDPSGQLLSTAYRKVRDSKGLDYSINDLIKCITADREIQNKRTGFSAQTIRAVIRRLSDLSNMPLFSPRKTLDIRTIFKEGTVSIFLLRAVDDSTRSLIVSQVVGYIISARGEAWENSEAARRLHQKAKKMRGETKTELLKKAKDLEEKSNDLGIPPGWVFLDEAHTLCPSEGQSGAKNILIEYVKQGRSMGLSLVAATQQPSALSSQLISQRDLIILHNLGIKSDIDAALNKMNPSFPDTIGTRRDGQTKNIPQVMINSLRRGEAIISYDEVSRNFIIKIRPRVTAHGGKEPIFI